MSDRGSADGAQRPRTVALLHPGEMGAALGACLAARGHRVVWASDARSAQTQARAAAAGLVDLASLGACLDAAEVAFAVCPPHGALAREVAAHGFRGTYVDANALSPASAREIARIVRAAGARYVDGGIIGPPPRPGAGSRLYLSGEGAAQIAALFAGSGMQATVLEGSPVAASALKACDAACNKGATALLACVRALAAHEGVAPALLAEWARSQPGLEKRSEAIRGSARKAWRAAPEMEEIATAFAAAGLPREFHLAAAEVYRRLASYKDAAERPSLAAVAESLRRGPPGAA